MEPTKPRAASGQLDQRRQAQGYQVHERLSTSGAGPLISHERDLQLTKEVKDKSSRYLIDRVIGERDPHDTADDMFLRIAIFNLFKRTDTYEAIKEACDGRICASSIDWSGLYNRQQTGILDELAVEQGSLSACVRSVTLCRLTAVQRHRPIRIADRQTVLVDPFIIVASTLYSA